MILYDMGRSFRETSKGSCGPSSIAVSNHALMLSRHHRPTPATFFDMTSRSSRKSIEKAEVAVKQGDRSGCGRRSSRKM
jgi:hypothetical protein